MAARRAVELLCVHGSGECFRDGLDGVGGISIVGLDKRLEPHDCGGGRFGIEGRSRRRGWRRLPRARCGWPAPAGPRRIPTRRAMRAPRRHPRGSPSRHCPRSPAPCPIPRLPATPFTVCASRSASGSVSIAQRRGDLRRRIALAWPRTARAGSGTDACSRPRASGRRRCRCPRSRAVAPRRPRRPASRRRRCRGVLARLRPARQGGEQRIRIDRLGHVVVHAGVQAALPLLHQRVRRHGDDREVLESRVRAQQPGRRVAVHLGHLQVHQDDVERRRLRALAAASSPPSPPWLAIVTTAPGALQQFGGHLLVHLVVFHQQDPDPARVVLGGSSLRGARGSPSRVRRRRTGPSACRTAPTR